MVIRLMRSTLKLSKAVFDDITLPYDRINDPDPNISVSPELLLHCATKLLKISDTSEMRRAHCRQYESAHSYKRNNYFRTVDD